jgi:hypothetical protein
LTPAGLVIKAAGVLKIYGKGGENLIEIKGFCISLLNI